MPDISMCANPTCPMKRTCYRHQASGTKPHAWRQAWGDYGPTKVEVGDEIYFTCDAYDCVDPVKNGAPA